MHEVGHSFRIGEANDTSWLPFGEVYSGERVDKSPEELSHQGKQWSIMSVGWQSNALIAANQTNRYGFSIEELFTIENPSQ